MKILIADDHLDSVKALSALLSHCGYETEEAFAGHGAEACLRQREYDLVVMDYLIEDLTGLDVLRWMRLRRYRTPVVMVTGVAEDISQEIVSHVNAEKLHPCIVLTKPYPPELLLSTIAELTARPETTTTVTQTTQQTLTITQETKQ